MKAKSKREIAELAGVSVDTLENWFKPHRAELTALGLKPRMRLLPPRIVKFIADTFDIDIKD